MQKILRTAALAVIAVATPAFAHDDPVAKPPVAPPAAEAPAKPAADVEWFADFDKAVEAAKAQKKDLLVDFTGSDWCGWCIKLHEEVFDKDAFKAAAPKDYILVALDFPNGPEAKAKVPNPERNRELAQKYKIRGYPSILVMSADGETLGRTGYAEGGPEKYVESLGKLRTAGREAVTVAKGLESEFAAAAPDARAAVVEKAMGLLAKAGDGPTTRLAGIVRQSAAIDPENKSGLRVRGLKSVFAAGEAGEADHVAARSIDGKNEHGLLEQVVHAQLGTLRETGEGIDAFIAEALALAKTGNLKDEEVYVDVLANAAGMAMQFGDKEQGRVIATILKERGPKGNARLDAFLEQVLSAKGAGEKPHDEHDGHDHGDNGDHDHGGDAKK